MTTPSETRAEIERLLTLLIQSDVALTAQPVILQRAAGGVERVTWSSLAPASGPLFRKPNASVAAYSEWIAAGGYNAILFDGALLQLSYDYLHQEPVAHRLVYYPCPFDLDLGLLKETPILDLIDLYAASREVEVFLRSPLRFDYDQRPHARQHGHPASHLTLLSEDCRWAVTAPLSPGHFVRFIFRHFYPSLWSALSFLRDWPVTHGHRTITDAEASQLHISCGITG